MAVSRTFRGVVSLDVRDSRPDWRPYEAAMPNIVPRDPDTAGRFSLAGGGVTAGCDGAGPVTID
jgi:hypothetical protein